MALRNILTKEDPTLYKVCRPVNKFDARLHQLLDDMRETLIDSGGASAENVLRRLDEKGLRAEKGRRGVTKIFCSANRENFLTIAKAVLDRDIDRHLELV